MNKYVFSTEVSYWGRLHRVLKIGAITTSFGTMYKYDLVDVENGVHRFDVAETEIKDVCN